MTPCPGGLTRVSNRPHPFCRGGAEYPACTLWRYAAEFLSGAIQPALTDRDGRVVCQNKVHASAAGNPSV